MELKDIQIFLCYTRSDLSTIKKIYKKLFERGFVPWMDMQNILPGEDWRLSIEEAIRRSDFFLACLSNNAVNKRGFLQREIQQALDIWKEKLQSDIYLIPLRIEDCNIPDSLSRFQYVDIFEADGWDKLIHSIEIGIIRRHETTSFALTDTHTSATSDIKGCLLSTDKPKFEALLPLFDNHIFSDIYAPNIEKSLSSEFGWSSEKAHSAFFVLTELVSNAFEHGCKGRGEYAVFFSVAIEAEGTRLIIRVKSPGTGFKLSDVLNKASALSPETRRGRGLWFVNRISDRLLASSDGTVIQSIINKDSKPSDLNKTFELSAQISVYGNKTVRVVPLDNEQLDMYTSWELKKYIFEVLKNQPEVSGIILDLNKVKQADSEGLATLLSLVSICKNAHLFIAFANCSSNITHLLKSCYPDESLPLYYSINDARLAFKREAPYLPIDRTVFSTKGEKGDKQPLKSDEKNSESDEENSESDVENSELDLKESWAYFFKKTLLYSAIAVLIYWLASIVRIMAILLFTIFAILLIIDGLKSLVAAIAAIISLPTCVPGMGRSYRGVSPRTRCTRSLRLGEGQGRHREVSSGGSPIQRCGATYRNQIRGVV